MSSLGSPNPFFIAGKKAYEIERSLRFNDDDSAYLSRTPSSAGNRRTFTISLWAKRANFSGAMFGSWISDTDRATLRFTSDFLEFQQTGYSVKTNAVFRDPSAWYHIVCAIDTTQGTQSNRGKLYVNGVEQTLSSNNFPQDHQTSVNNNSIQTIGTRWISGANSLFDGYLAEVNLIDGLALDASYFGATDVLTGQWNPKKYTGSYGTNGFYLNFSTDTLGTDRSGNGNDFTPNNFSVVAGAGNDALSDSPTNNFCTLNAVAKGSGVSLSQGNLGYNSSGREGVVGTFAVRSGKWYWEVTASDVGADTQVGIYDNTDGKGFPTSYLGVNSSSWGVISGNGNTIHNTSQASYGSSFSDGDILMVALDMDNGKWYLGKNGSWYNSGNPASSTNPAHSGITSGTGLISPAISNNTENNMDYQFNFGQRAFSYTPPTGFEKLNSANLPDPTIKLPNQHFSTLLYTGNSTDNRAITGLNFQPDLTWIKRRSGGAQSHFWVDALRSNTDGSGGNGNVGPLATNDTYAETNTLTDGGFESFNSDGFTLGKGSATHNADAPYQRNNASGETYCAWNWDAGETDGKTYTVKVVSDSGNKYRFDDFGTSAVTLDLAEGGTYIFDQSDSSNSGHPLRFSTTSNGTHGGGSEYTTGVTTAGTPGQSGAYTQIVVAASAPTLYYYCSVHSGMGGQANTNSTLGSSNFDGSVQSTVKVSASAGFSIVTFSGSGNRTIGHGLGVAPKAIIMKGRNVSDQWTVGHQELDASNPWHKGIPLNTDATTQDNATFWNDTAPTSTVFSKGSWNENYNMIAYCFSEVAGYSKFGSYVGNGSSSDGTFVYTGFKPAFILTKSTTSNHWWEMADNTRTEFNPRDKTLYSNQSDSEYSGSQYYKDFLSNGFKARSDNGGHNGSGNTYIYLAFASSPFKNTRAG